MTEQGRERYEAARARDEVVVTIMPPSHFWAPYYLTLTDGPTACERGWFVFGRRWAEHKARRIVAARKRENERYRARWQVR